MFVFICDWWFWCGDFVCGCVIDGFCVYVWVLSYGIGGVDWCRCVFGVECVLGCLCRILDDLF